LGAILELLDLVIEFLLLLKLTLQEVLELLLVLLILLFLEIFLLIKILQLGHVHLHLLFLGLQDRLLVLFQLVV